MKIFLRLLFAGLVIVGFMVVERICRQKGNRDEVIREFFFGNKPPDAYDVIAFGSSYMYCTVNPVQLYRDTGLRSYVPGTAIQPVEMTYHYLKLALRKYHPQLVMVGSSLFVFRPKPTPYREGYAHFASDPFPLGIDKVQMLADQHLEDSMENYLFPFLKYHARWKNLKKNDFCLSHRPPGVKDGLFMGFQLNTRCTTNSVTQIDFAKEKCSPMSEESIMYLEKIVELCKANGVKLLLFNSVRNSARAQGRLATLHRIAAERKIDFLDLNEVFNETGISNATDFHDVGHLNITGAEKATRYLGRYLQRHYQLKVCQDAQERKQWDAICQHYDEVKKSLLKIR